MISRLSAGLGSSGPTCLCWSLHIAEEFDGVGDEGQEITTTVDVQMLLEAFFNVSLRTACATDGVIFFSGKRQNFRAWDNSSQMTDYQDFQIIGRWIKGAFVICDFKNCKVRHKI